MRDRRPRGHVHPEDVAAVLGTSVDELRTQTHAATAAEDLATRVPERVDRLGSRRDDVDGPDRPSGFRSA